MFADRVDAGRRLAEKLQHLRGEDLVVLGLPRGGVPVAYEVATALNAPLDVIVVRKLGVPSQPELGMGAIGEDGVRIINSEVMRMAAVNESELERVVQREQVELERRASRFRRGRPRMPLSGRTALVVDDGIATGSTARAACQVARAHGAARVVLGVPVAPLGWTIDVGEDADEFVCLETPRAFFAISQFYGDFTQTTDDEVISCLERSASAATSSTVSAAAVREAAVSRGNDRYDPMVEAEREEANGVELFEDASAGQVLLVAREEAQGVELFEDPDAVMPATALRQGAPGHESFGGDLAAFRPDEEEIRERESDEPRES